MIAHLKVIYDPADNLRDACFLCQLDCSFDNLFVVTSIKSHSSYPERLEKVGQNVVFDVLRGDTFSGRTLLHDLKNDLFHLLIRGLELSNKNDGNFFGVI